MVDLVVKSGTVLVVDAAHPLAPEYRLLRMEANSRIVTGIDLVLRADRAEFADNCLIDARGQAGAPGTDASLPPATRPPGALPTAGAAGGPGGDGCNVTIEAGLAVGGQLTVVASGGSGGNGGMGQVGFNSGVSDGGSGGAGGRGGNAGSVSIVWTALSGSIRGEQDVPPAGHAYISAGGAGGLGGAGGPAGRDSFKTGPRGADGAAGTGGLVEVRWKAGMTSLLWVQRQHFGPAARSLHAVAFDPDRQRLILFGGRGEGGALGDTWEWDGQLWCQVADTGPAPRSGHAMAYDHATRRILLFGGKTEDDTLLGDSWIWDGSWVQLADSGPPAREEHAMASDPARARIVLFGGIVGRSTTASDTWEWDGVQWAEIQDVGPSARSGARLAWDAGGGVVILFGGGSFSVGTPDPSTWGWDGIHWKQLTDMGPIARFRHAMSAAEGGVILFGGFGLDPLGTPNVRLKDTWAWSQGLWRQIQDIGPAPRFGHAMDFDPAGKVIAFGGEQGPALFADTWQLSARA